MRRLIDSLRQAVPDGLEEIQTLAKTLTERASDNPGLLRPPPYLQRPYRSSQRAPGAPTRHRPGLPQPHQLHHPQPHPRRTPQRPPGNNHLNQAISPTYNTLKYEEPTKMVAEEVTIPPRSPRKPSTGRRRQRITYPTMTTSRTKLLHLITLRPSAGGRKKGGQTAFRNPMLMRFSPSKRRSGTP